jgi:primosomal protein N' (replication factor Y)
MPYEKLKRAIEVLDKQSIFPDDIYQLCQWAADYYHYALGEVLSSALPSALRKGKEAIVKSKAIVVKDSEDKPLLLNEAQQHAVHAIQSAKNSFKVFLLDGVTGSGKTEVYLQVMEETLNQNKQILVLVPEISLTPQTVERFRSRFSMPIVVLHSNLSEKVRLRAWLSAKSGDAKIVIGTRSAIFTPFANLGLLVVDEEHDVSFKQQDRFRYHARDLAIMRASLNKIPIILGSATPSLESLLNVARNRYELLSLPQRAGNAKLPEYQLLDIKRANLEEGLSTELIEAMREHLDKDNQVILFLNRRGYAPVLYCTQCAFIVECKRCDARMVYHRSPPRLQCHHCDARSKIPTLCAKCNEASLQPIGFGTQRLEQTLSKYFRDIPIIRVDRDSTKNKGAMENLLEEIHKNSKAILIGTQMLAKGHHFPKVTLVGIVDADGGLFSSDFRAAEQMGQLLMQVSGRAGRVDKPGTVIIQTRHKDHELLQLLIHQGYQAFAKTLLREREISVLPPFSYFAVFRAESYSVQNAQSFLKAIKEMLPVASESFSLLGPVSALMAKRKGLYCQHLLVKTHKRSVLQQALKAILHQLENLAASYSVKWILDVDPYEI